MLLNSTCLQLCNIEAEIETISFFSLGGESSGFKINCLSMTLNIASKLNGFFLNTM